MTLVFTAVMSKKDVTLCKLDVNVKNRRAVAGSFDFFKLKKKPFKGKSASFTLKMKCGESKGMQEKISIMGVWCG